MPDRVLPIFLAILQIFEVSVDYRLVSQKSKYHSKLFRGGGGLLSLSLNIRRLKRTGTSVIMK